MSTFATVVCDQVYNSEELQDIINNIDKIGGLFKRNDLLDVKVYKTFTITVKGQDDKYIYYLSNNPTTTKVTVAVLEAYDPQGWVNIKWGKGDLDPATENYFFSELESINNFVHVFRKNIQNVVEIKNKLIELGIIVKEEKQTQPTQPTNNSIPGYDIPPEVPDKPINTSNGELSAILQNPAVLMGIVGLVVVFLIMKK